jgi:hypothetical protein
MDGELCDIDVLCNFINSSMVSATSYQKLIYLSVTKAPIRCGSIHLG